MIGIRSSGISRYIRTLRLKYLSELPNRVQARLRENSKLQSIDEDRWAERLGLSIAPRLSLVDEENASLITGAERAYLEQRDAGETEQGGSVAEAGSG